MDGTPVENAVEEFGEPMLVFRGSEEQQAKLDAALAAATAEFESVEKDREGQYGAQRFKYATLGHLISATRPALAAHGIVVMQFINSVRGDKTRQRITTMLRGHGASISSSLEFVPRETRDENSNRSFEAIKEYGKVRTYLRRYEYQTLLMLDAEPDADEAGMPGRDDRENERKAPPRRQAPAPDERPRASKAPEAPAPAPKAASAPAAAPPATESKPLNFDKPMARPAVNEQSTVAVSAHPVSDAPTGKPPADSLAQKLSTVAPEPRVEPEDGPADAEILETLIGLQRELKMGKMELAHLCENEWGVPPSSIRQSMAAAKKVERCMRDLLEERQKAGAPAEPKGANAA